MLVRIGLLRKKVEWDSKVFRRHWLEHHGALARQLMGLRGYAQNHVVDREQRGINFARGPEEFDGFSQLWFDNDAAMRAAIATDLGRTLVADENHFIGDLRVALVQENEVIAPAKDRPLVKRMSLLRRRADVTPERFRDEWKEVHASLVTTMPNVRGYRQNLIVERQVPKGTPVGYERLPIDGIVELWFDSVEALVAAFASPEGQRTMAHAQSFIAEITTFLVETYVIV